MNDAERKRLERQRKADNLVRLDIWVPSRMFAELKSYITRKIKENAK